MNNLSELKRKYEALGKEIENLEGKKWPDSHREARLLSDFWGFWCEYAGNIQRYLILNTKPTGCGIPVCGVRCFSTADEMENFWGKHEDSIYDDYGFIMFKSEKELYDWVGETIK